MQTVLSDYSELIAAALGALMGWGLFELSAKIRYEREEREKAANVRLMLSVEFEQNLAILRHFKTKLVNIRMYYPDDFNRVRFVLTNDMPIFRHQMWDGLLNELPMTLRPLEIKNLALFYQRLEYIASYRPLVEQYPNPSPFLINLFEACNKEVTKLLEQESPLHPHIEIHDPSPPLPPDRPSIGRLRGE